METFPTVDGPRGLTQNRHTKIFLRTYYSFMLEIIKKNSRLIKKKSYTRVSGFSLK